MAVPNNFKTLSPFKFSPEDELRLSVKKGLEVHFFKALSKFDGDNLEEIINKKYSLNDENEMTLLIEASLYGHLKIIKHLVEKFNIGINVAGKVKHFGSVVDGATALWCAAGSGHLEIVKTLIENGANVDSCTKTKSTPLRAACYLGRSDIVKYLIEHGANVNVTNVYNSTCLMIASYKGHVDVVNYLLKSGAEVNHQTNCGSTAMHFAAQANNVKIAESLLEFNALQLKNNQFLTPILVAAERTHLVLVYYLLDVLNLTLEERIEVEELLGASFLNDKDTYDKHLGYSILLHSMEMRYNNHPVISKKVYKQIEAYDNRVECQTIEDLRRIKDNTEALHYESLIIREKILGCNNLDLLQSIIYRGAVYADSNDFIPCLKLWSHAMNIAQNNKVSIYKDLLRFTQVFCQMIKANIKIKLLDLKNVLKVAVEELKVNQKKISAAISLDDKEAIEREYIGNILSTLGLIIITSITLELDSCHYNDPLIGDVMKTIVEINKLELRTKGDQTLLHLCLSYDTNVDNVFTTGICCFPNYLSMKLLIYCGADVNAIDYDQNTPLHYIGKFIIDFPHIPHKSDYFDTKKMAMELLNAGAHSDFVNKDGVCPHTGYLNILFPSTNRTPRSLKCLSAKVVKYKCPKESYHNQLPKFLEDFTNMH